MGVGKLKGSKLGKQKAVGKRENQGISHDTKCVPPSDRPWTRQRKYCLCRKAME